MKMMPPPIITIMKMDITMEPGRRYWIYGTYGYTSTTVQRRLPGHTLGRRWLVVRDQQRAETPGERAGDHVVGVVLDERDPRLIPGQDATGKFGWDREHAVHDAVAKVPDRLSFVCVVQQIERPRA